MNLNQPEKVLLAAYNLDKDGKKRFSVEDLIVTSWKLFPDSFGLDGYIGDDGKPMYPDAEKIHKKYGELKGHLIVLDIQKGPNGLGISLAQNSKNFAVRS